MSSAVTRRLLVSGRVQGVGYRVWCASLGRRLDLSGRVRNLPDGRVEVLVAGEAELVGHFVAWCREGPPAAVVADVVVEDCAEGVDLAGGFSIGG